MFGRYGLGDYGGCWGVTCKLDGLIQKYVDTRNRVISVSKPFSLEKTHAYKYHVQKIRNPLRIPNPYSVAAFLGH